MKIGRENDGRYALTPDMERELQNDIDNGLLTRKELAKKYSISLSKIWQLCNPKQHKKNYEVRKKSQHGGKYYNRETHTADQKRYREKLKALNEKESKSG